MKSALFHLIIAVVLCAAIFAVYGMVYAAVSKKSAAVADLQNRIETKTESINRINVTRTTLAGVADDEAIMQSYFVPETGVVAFIDSLETRAKVFGTTASILSVSTIGMAAQPSLSLSLTIKGTFSSVMRTVGSIEYAPYNLSIASLSVTQDAKDMWNAGLTLVVGSVSTKRAATSTP